MCDGLGAPVLCSGFIEGVRLRGVLASLASRSLHITQSGRGACDSPVI